MVREFREKGSRAARGLGAGLLAFTILFAPPSSVLAASDPGTTAGEVARDLSLQRDLPGSRNEIVTPNTEAKRTERPRTDFGNGGTLGAFIHILLYGAIAVGIAFAIWTMRDSLPVLGRRRLVARETGKMVREGVVERMAVAQIEADELARQGQIAEAMHALLLRSLIEVRRRLNISFADSLTSREILKALSLPEIGKVSLTDIIRRVELVYFGEYPASAQDYAACRASYENLTQAMQVRMAL